MANSGNFAFQASSKAERSLPERALDGILGDGLHVRRSRDGVAQRFQFGDTASHILLASEDSEGNSVRLGAVGDDPDVADALIAKLARNCGCRLAA